MSSSKNNLEIHGTLSEHPFAELIAEASKAKFSGSFRISQEAEKAIVYLKNGDVIFAVSNARKHHLFDKLLRENKISREVLAQTPNFANDLEFSRELIKKELFTEAEIENFFTEIIEEILRSVCLWESGAWIFSPLAQVRSDISFPVNTVKILIDYARQRPFEFITSRFRSFEEAFESAADFPAENLSPYEGFIFSRFENQPLTITEIRILSSLPDAEVLKSLYILWLGGFIRRRKWNSAFTENQLQAIKNAKLTLKKEAVVAPASAETVSTTAADTPETTEKEAASLAKETTANELSVQEYLEKVESALTYYETLGVSPEASISDIKAAYFKLAKNFHPDKYHQEADLKLQQRIQHAFTEIAKAYETLRSQDTKEIYDFKLRKILKEMGAAQKNQTPPESSAPLKEQTSEDRAREDFDSGFNFLMNEDYVRALPYLHRAVQTAPGHARYHAYYAKAISQDEKQRFKADAEFQTAIRLEPANPTFRLMLAEFYIQYNLLKRAEGELHRLLAIAPDNKEARLLLDSLAKK